MIPHLGLPELLIILVIIVIVFGVGRLPEIGGAIGKGIREFRRSQDSSDTAEAKPKDAGENSSKSA